MAITVDPNEPFHVLLGGQVTPVSLEVLDALYQDDTIEESTLIWQQGLGEWLRLDAVLAELEKQEPPAPQQRDVEPDAYYVSFGDSDVRLLSLDQLDKFYDLEVIDDSTLVWQPGFAEWIPLAVLIGEPDAPAVSIHPSLGPQQSRANSSAPGFSAPLSSPAQQGSVAQRGSVAPQNFSAPAPVGFGPQGYSAPQGYSTPQSVRPAAPSARPLPAPSVRPSSFSAPYSLAPNSLQEPLGLALSAIPERPKASPWFGRGLLAATLFAGLLVVQRNGVMMELAEGAGQKDSWQDVEASLGGTSLDTPQGLAVWLTDLSTRHGLGSLTPTDPIAPEVPKAEPAFATTPLPSTPTGSESSKSTPSPQGISAADTKAVDVAEKMRAKLAGEAERAPAPMTQRSISRPAVKAVKKRKNTGADAYDPMNGTL